MNKIYVSIIIVLLFGCSPTDLKDPDAYEQIWVESSTPIYELTEIHPGGTFTDPGAGYGRFPNIISNNAGVVITTWGIDSIFVKVSRDSGNNWSDKIFISEGINGGGLTFNRSNNEVLFFFESFHPVGSEIFLVKSNNFFDTFSKTNVTNQFSPHSVHMNDHGIILESNKHSPGRIIIPTRNYGNANNEENWPIHYSNSFYSDDNGESWNVGGQFPVYGTGEGSVVELKNGDLIYNSRRHYSSTNYIETRNRNIAYSYDGGLNWTNHEIDLELPDGDQCWDYGLMGSLINVPYPEKDFFLFSNIDSECGRENGTIWFTNENDDSNWRKKLIFQGSFAYSSITFNINPETKEDEIFIFFESNFGGTILKTNLAFLKAN